MQSSTQIIDADGVKILTDPWLTSGEYYGSWYHWPPFPEEKIKDLQYDYIYVSHIHPDHLSENTFKKLPIKKPVLIHNWSSKFVKFKLQALGYEVIECSHGIPFKFNDTSSITIFAADNCNPELCGKFFGCGIVEDKYGSTQIDTLALIKSKNQSILNTNDCPFELASNAIIQNLLHKKAIDVLLVGYTGAGPYPQCFEFKSLDDKLAAAKKKNAQFIQQAKNFIELIKPKAYVPFAGTYELGSKLNELSQYRGASTVPEAINALSIALEGSVSGVHLEQFDFYDITQNEVIKNTNTISISKEYYIKTIANKPLTYDEDDWDDIELPGLLETAYDRFYSKCAELKYQSPTTIIIESCNSVIKFTTSEEPKFIEKFSPNGQQYLRIKLSHNLLHRLLRGPRYAHWNNANIGSHLKFDRNPNDFERGLFHCLNFFHT